MTVEWRHGDERGTLPCDDGTFLVGYSYTDAKGYHIATMDDEATFRSLCEHSARGLTCRTVEHPFPDGAVLRLLCLSTADPTLRAVMERRAGVKQTEVSCNGFSLTVTV